MADICVGLFLFVCLFCFCHELDNVHLPFFRESIGEFLNVKEVYLVPTVTINRVSAKMLAVLNQ